MKMFVVLFGTLFIFAAGVRGDNTNNEMRKCNNFNEYCQTDLDCCSNRCLSFLYRCTKNSTEYPQNQPPAEPSTIEAILGATFGGSKQSAIKEQANQLQPSVESRFDDENPVKSVYPPRTYGPYIVKANCLEIGEFCMRSEDCCSKRCLSYKARCVT